MKDRILQKINKVFEKGGYAFKPHVKKVPSGPGEAAIFDGVEVKRIPTRWLMVKYYTYVRSEKIPLSNKDSKEIYDRIVGMSREDDVDKVEEYLNS